MNHTKDDRGQSWWDLFPIITETNAGIVQVNASLIYPGAIKGLHAHEHQTDYWFCAAGNLLVMLSPDKEDCETRFLSAGDPPLPILPRWWHGCRAIGGTSAFLIYGVTHRYNPEHPDEERIPWDHFGKDIWEMQPR